MKMIRLQNYAFKLDKEKNPKTCEIEGLNVRI